MGENTENKFASYLVQSAERVPAVQALKLAVPISDVYQQLSESPGANSLINIINKSF
jgi:hypothetical protein